MLLTHCGGRWAQTPSEQNRGYPADRAKDKAARGDESGATQSAVVRDHPTATPTTRGRGDAGFETWSSFGECCLYRRHAFQRAGRRPIVGRYTRSGTTH